MLTATVRFLCCSWSTTEGCGLGLIEWFLSKYLYEVLVSLLGLQRFLLGSSLLHITSST